MKIGVPRERIEGERRVSLVPKIVKELIGKDHSVLVESGAGEAAGFSDSDYEDAGASIAKDAGAVFAESDSLIKCNIFTDDELDLLDENQVLIGTLSPMNNLGLMQQLAGKHTTTFAMEFLPRITRAQSMDILSSMSTVAGYKAVLLAADTLPKFFPLLMTAAGTIPPANALVIGAGVAGLQAIATAKRLGARVSAFDTRPAVQEQVESLGARFVEMELEEEAETEGGYAREMTEEFYQKELEVIGARAEKSDLIISTALIFGKKAPILITEDMLQRMQPGSVVVDLAAVNGGNCEMTEPGKSVVKHGVTIHAPLNLPAELPTHASQMFAKNISNFIAELYKDESDAFDFENQVVNDSCVIHDGEIRNELIQNALNEKGE